MSQILHRQQHSLKLAIALASILWPLTGCVLDGEMEGGGSISPRLPQLWTPAAISTEGYESSPTFSPDGLDMFFVSADRDFRNYQILHSRCKSGQWSTPKPAWFAAPSPAIEADPFITPDGRRLYYVSTRHAPEQDDFDIWYVEKQADQTWTEPQRLPEPVNSTQSELLPRTTSDGKLYFGSSRPGGLGQSDIYVASRDAHGEWTVSNVGPPVSTAANEFEAEISADGQSMVVVADRSGKSHLYRFLKRSGGWKGVGAVSASNDVFQVGPLLSPKGDRLLFAQSDGQRSGEMFLIDLTPSPDPRWPPCAMFKR